MTEKPKRRTIIELVKWIDDNKSKLIKSYDDFGGMGLILCFVVAVLYLVTFVVNIAVSDFVITISIQLTNLAIIISFIAFTINFGEKRKLGIRYERIIKEKDFNDRDKALLKALIKIKNNNEKIKLITIYKMDKEAHGNIFSEKKLLQSICD